MQPFEMVNNMNLHQKTLVLNEMLSINQDGRIPHLSCMFYVQDAQKRRRNFMTAVHMDP